MANRACPPLDTPVDQACPQSSFAARWGNSLLSEMLLASTGVLIIVEAI
jgi:hypothetical protein